jgi:hypothetical protein
MFDKLSDSAGASVTKSLSLSLTALPENETSYPYPSGTLVQVLVSSTIDGMGDEASSLLTGLYGIAGFQMLPNVSQAPEVYKVVRLNNEIVGISLNIVPNPWVISLVIKGVSMQIMTVTPYTAGIGQVQIYKIKD